MLFLKLFVFVVMHIYFFMLGLLAVLSVIALILWLE